VVLGLHAAGAAMLLSWHDLVAVGEPSDAVAVDLAPFEPPSDTVEDLPAGPKQEEAEAPPPPPKQDVVEQKQEEKVDVPPTPAPAVAALPPPEPVNPKPPEPVPVPPAPATTAPPRAHASRAQINKWYSGIVTQIERNKAYPRAAQERGETGVVQLAFSIDRQGRVVSSAIVKSSGYSALDQETMATVRRAQPFPAPPADLDGAKFDFTVPVKFNIR
jgi:protein TonB